MGARAARSADDSAWTTGSQPVTLIAMNLDERPYPDIDIITAARVMLCDIAGAMGVPVLPLYLSLMKRKAFTKKPLALNLETIRQLSADQLPRVVGGEEPATTTDNCSACQTCTKH